MQSFFLRCHPPGAAAPPSTFFLLSRGNNAGRPSFTPNPNCFALSCDPGDLDGFYWFVYALWETGHFRPLIFGTVIPMVRITEVRRLIRDSLPWRDRIEQALPTLHSLRELEANYKKQLALIQQCRRALLFRINRPDGAPAGPVPTQPIFHP